MLKHRLLFVFAFATLVVWSHWNFFTHGVFALGLNLTLFWFGFALVIRSDDASYNLKRDWPWFIPLLFIALSFSLFENPWLKFISLFVMPLGASVFCAYSHFREREQHYWNLAFLIVIVERCVKPLLTKCAAFDVFASATGDVADKKAAIAKPLSRILVGVGFLIPLGVFATTLLSSADASFGAFVVNTIETLFTGMSWLWLLKMFVAIMLTLVLLSVAAAWSEEIVYVQEPSKEHIDGLVVGIVLGGLLLIYMSFLALQVDKLIIEELPELYVEAERMVKSGFWQLFTLAVLNTVLFFTVYRKTGAAAQWVLRVFIVASSLLMASAAWKVWLYSYTFGLSYEKYFACYTAIFSLGVLLYLVMASFFTERRNVIKSITFAALWCYAIASITPVERIIFKANVYFAGQENTRIILGQLDQLSLDIKADLNRDRLSTLASTSADQLAWRNWHVKVQRQSCEHAWYESNLSRLRFCK